MSKLVSCWLFGENGEVVETYHCQSAYNLTRRVDVAGHELADEVCRHADNGDHGDDTEAAGDKKGPRKWGGGCHFCWRLGPLLCFGFYRSSGRLGRVFLSLKSMSASGRSNCVDVVR